MTNNSDLYFELRPYLHTNEQVLWSGRPNVIKLSGKSIYTTVFSAIFMSFAVFWMIGASAAGGPFFLFGIPFFFVGAGLFYSTTIGHKNGLKNSIYAVTETRAIIIVTLPRKGTSCTEYVFSNLSSVNLENVKDDVGTIRFENVTLYDYEYGGYSSRRRTTTYIPEREFTTAFVMINDVHSVYHMISERLGR